MRVTRRQFLKAGSVTAGLIASPHLLLTALRARKAHAMGPLDPILVVIQWDGGNDGLNTVIPLDDANGRMQRTMYEQFRPQLRLTPAELANTNLGDDPAGTAVALHPEMSGLHELYDQGKVAIVNAVGYPQSSQSHFTSEEIWFTANPEEDRERGWVGTLMDETLPPPPSLPRAVSFARNISPIFRAFDATSLQLNEVADFGLPDDPVLQYRDVANRIGVWSTIYDREILRNDPAPVAEDVAIDIARNADALITADSTLLEISQNWMDGAPNLQVLAGGGNNLAEDLFQVAAVIHYDVNSGADSGLRFFHVRLGGFDTHSRQGGTHEDLLKFSSDAIKALYDDLIVIGGSALADRTLILTFSEFGRRPTENGDGSSAGTDHGTAAPLFVIGNAVNVDPTKKMYGSLPDLEDLFPEGDDQEGNLRFEYDFRQVYATIIQNWLGVSPSLVIPGSEVWTPIPDLLP